jgi:hypothetical protein
MKQKLKTKLYTLLFVLSVMTAQFGVAQIGSSPSNPIIISPGNTSTSYALADSVTWFKWQNDSSSVEISMNLITNGSKYKLLKMMLYTGVTTNSVYINQD